MNLIELSCINITKIIKTFHLSVIHVLQNGELNISVAMVLRVLVTMTVSATHFERYPGIGIGDNVLVFAE